MKYLILTFITTLITSSLNAEKLTCDRVGDLLTQLPSRDVRPYCDTAELRCHAHKKLQNFPANDPLRISLDPKLTAQMEYELEVCEMAVRKIQPNLLLPRKAGE